MKNLKERSGQMPYMIDESKNSDWSKKGMVMTPR